MNKKLFACAAAFLVFPLSFIFSLAEIPALEKPVMDMAGIVGEKTEAKLDEYLRAVSDQTGIQIAVLTVDTTEEETIEDYSIRVCQSWKLGQKGENNGVLLTVAYSDHRLRIEVGYGLEHLLTDVTCSRIIREIITPAFREDMYSSGILDGVLKITEIALDGKELSGEAVENIRKNEGSKVATIVFLVWLFFAVTIILGGTGVLPYAFCMMTGRPYVRRRYSSGPVIFGDGDFSDGGSFGDSGSSGGYSGGGGDFGGGGSSGSW